jgi:SAM-dependent methyltransferase
MPPGFRREQLRERYDVAAFQEDSWHAYCGQETRRIINSALSRPTTPSNRLLNAGSGVYRLDVPGWDELAVDIFETPLGGRGNTFCASIESLPIDQETFGAIVCVGEVLGYCDPQLAIKEFGRILQRKGSLVCDFGSSLSFRYQMRECHGREADIVSDEYNGTAERVWIYNPRFIRRLLRANGFEVIREYGTHTWSSLATRIGASKARATEFQRSMDWMPLPKRWADVCTIIAEKI